MTATDPLVARARNLCEELLAPQAGAVDQGAVPRSHLDALAAAGVLGMAAPVAHGGAGAPAAVQREVTELLAGADLATWFVQAQHQSVTRQLAALGEPRVARLADRSAATVAGVAFSHLRRWPQRPVAATRLATGWQLDGAAPWYTGWGVNDVALIAGVTEDGEVIWCWVPAVPAPGLQAGPAMSLAALSATATVRLELTALVVKDSEVVARQPITQWLARDERNTAEVSPAVFGLTAAVAAGLTELAEQRAEPGGVHLAGLVQRQLSELRGRAYQLMDEPDAGDLGERIALRAKALQLAQLAAAGYVSAASGAAMTLGHPAQRHAREALFLLVQAQTAVSRAASLEAITGQVVALTSKVSPV